MPVEFADVRIEVITQRKFRGVQCAPSSAERNSDKIQVLLVSRADVRTEKHMQCVPDALFDILGCSWRR